MTGFILTNIIRDSDSSVDTAKCANKKYYKISAIILHVYKNNVD